jgi:6-phosphogluconolactonase
MGWIALLLACASIGHSADGTAQPAPSSKRGTQMVYAGTYTQGKSKGIYLLELDMETGALTVAGSGPQVVNPSFLAIHPNRRFLYACNETGDFEGQKSGAVSAFAIAPETGQLTLLNRQASRGTAPCHLTVDREGKHVLVANYSSGSVAVLPILPDGKLGPATGFVQHEGHGPNPARQEGPHAHSINLDAANRFAVAADLGLDKLMVYRLDAARGTLTPNDPPSAPVAPGAGPRHFAFHPNGRFAYVINELNSTVTAFAWDALHGTLKELQAISTLPPDFQGTNYPAEVQVHPSGKFLYGSNRGHDSIVIYTINARTGQLRRIGNQPTGGRNPRNFCLDPTGTYLLAANQDSDNIVVFRIDPKTGGLSPTGHTAEVPKPVCVLMMPPAR